LIDGLDRAVDIGIGHAELMRNQLHQQVDPFDERRSIGHGSGRRRGFEKTFRRFGVFLERHLIPGIGPQSAGDGIDMVIDRAGKPEIAVHRVADRLYRKSIGIIIWELFRRGAAVRPRACESVSPAHPASLAHPGTWRSERTRKRFA
jgi:hypothetical protein